MDQTYYINRLYKITQGVLAGYSGRLVAYDSTTHEAKIKLEEDVCVDTRDEFIELIEKKCNLPKKRKFIVYHAYTSDTIVFDVPKHYTYEQAKEKVDETEVGNTFELDGKTYGWQYTDFLPAVLGIVDATTKEEALAVFGYNTHLLEAFEIL